MKKIEIRFQTCSYILSVCIIIFLCVLIDPVYSFQDRVLKKKVTLINDNGPLIKNLLVTMGFSNRPPYHYLEESINDKQKIIPRGLISDILVRSLEISRLNVIFEEAPAKRIMFQTKKEESFCSFSWFKNPERELFAKFSMSLWQDKPFIIVTNKEKKSFFQRHSTFAEMIKKETITLGSREPISYGSYIDTLLQKENKLTHIFFPALQVNLVRMLDANRFDFMIMAQEEVEDIFESAKVNIKNFTVIGYPDIPKGEKRRVMCSKGVADEWIDRLNQAILNGQGKYDPKIKLMEFETLLIH
jgi:polar amino acid transport system substrate-binding protein